MSRSLLSDAFEHHVWATLQVIGVCEALTDEQLATNVPGTYGSILDTLRHTVIADSWYLFRLTDGAHTPIPDEDEASLSLADMRSATEAHGPEWASVLAADPDPDRVIEVTRDDGSATHAPVGLRLAQVLHHGTDHRSQISTALTSLGMEPAELDLWSWGMATGRSVEISPST